MDKEKIVQIYALTSHIDMLHLAATLPALFHGHCSQEAGITPIMSLVLVESEHSVRYPLFTGDYKQVMAKTIQLDTKNYRI